MRNPLRRRHIIRFRPLTPEQLARIEELLSQVEPETTDASVRDVEHPMIERMKRLGYSDEMQRKIRERL